MSTRPSSLSVAAAVITLALTSSAAAAGPCAGTAPAKGESFRGPVLHVEDGQRLCVARGFDSSQWVEVQLVDASPQTERGALMSVAFAKDVDCRITGAGASARALCTVDGRSIGSLAAAPAARAAGREWR